MCNVHANKKDTLMFFWAVGEAFSGIKTPHSMTVLGASRCSLPIDQACAQDEPTIRHR
jgi:hypothetical protein